MPSYINTNVLSLNSQLQMNKSQSAMQNAMERLSSGLRINSAKDDPAGLAISSRMGAQIAGMNQAASNANNAISMTQTADGALGQINTMLGTLRQLAVQSADATNTASDRVSLQATAGKLIEQINTIANTTQFNGMNLLDGTLRDQTFQIGANAGQTLKVSVNGAKTSQLGTNDAAALTAQGSDYPIASGDLYINGTAIRSSSSGDDQASYPTSSKAASAIAKAAAVNASTAETGVSATVDANVSQGAAMIAGQKVSGTLKLNGVSLILGTTGNPASDRASIADAINRVQGQTGVIAKDTGSDDTGIQLTTADGRNISVQFGNGLDASNTGVRGLSAKTLSGQVMTAAPGTGTLTINGVSTDLVQATTNFADTRRNVTTAINAISDRTGVIAKDTGSDSGGVTLTSADGRHIDTAFNQVSGVFDFSNTGVSNALGMATTTSTAGALANASREQGSFSVNGTPISFVAGELLDATGSAANARANMQTIANKINNNAALGLAGIYADVYADGTFKILSANGASVTVDLSGMNNETAVFATPDNLSGLPITPSSTVATTGNTTTTAGFNDASLESGGYLAIAGYPVAFISLGYLADASGGNTSAALSNMNLIAGQINGNTNLQGLGIRATVDGATGAFTISRANGGAFSVSSFNLNLANIFTPPVPVSVSAAGAASPVTFPASPDSRAASTAEGTDFGGYTLTSDKSITVTTGGGVTASLANAGLASGTYSAQTAYTSASLNNGLPIQKDDVRINGIAVGASQAKSDTYSAYAVTVSADDAATMTAASAIAKAAAFNAVAEQTGVSATPNATTVKGVDMSLGLAGTGTLTINGVNTGTIGLASALNASSDADRLAAQNRTAIVNAINAIKDQTGVTATDTNDIKQGIQLTAPNGRNINLQFNAGLNSGNTGISGTSNIGVQTLAGRPMIAAPGAGAININGVTVNITLSGLDNDTNGGAVVAAINAVSDKTGVTAHYDGTAGGVSLSAVDGVGFSVGPFTGSLSSASTGLSAGAVGSGTTTTIPGKSSTSFGTYTLSATEQFTVDKGTTATLENTGLSVGTFGSGKSGMSLDKLDISTAVGATAAITALDNAMQQIDSNRGNLGAIQNGLSASIANLQTTSVNLSTAQSHIQDADFAAETARLSRAQILQEAGMAMLTQANASSQNVLSLLK